MRVPCRMTAPAASAASPAIAISASWSPVNGTVSGLALSGRSAASAATAASARAASASLAALAFVPPALSEELVAFGPPSWRRVDRLDSPATLLAELFPPTVTAPPGTDPPPAAGAARRRARRRARPGPRIRAWAAPVAVRGGWAEPRERARERERAPAPEGAREAAGAPEAPAPRGGQAWDLVRDPADHAVQVRNLPQGDNRKGQKSSGAGRCDDRDT